METGAVSVGGVGVYPAERLSGGYLLTFVHGKVGDAGIDGEIFAVAHKHYIMKAVHDNDHRNGSRIDGDRRGSRRSLYVDAVVLYLHFREFFMCVTSEI